MSESIGSCWGKRDSLSFSRCKWVLWDQSILLSYPPAPQRRFSSGSDGHSFSSLSPHSCSPWKAAHFPGVPSPPHHLYTVFLQRSPSLETARKNQHEAMLSTVLRQAGLCLSLQTLEPHPRFNSGSPLLTEVSYRCHFTSPNFNTLISQVVLIRVTTLWSC